MTSYKQSVFPSIANLLMCYVYTNQASKDQCLEPSRCVRNETVCMNPILKISVGESHSHDLAGCGLLALLPNVPVCSRSTFSEAVSVLVDLGLKCSPLLVIWENQILQVKHNLLEQRNKGQLNKP